MTAPPPHQLLETLDALYELLVLPPQLGVLPPQRLVLAAQFGVLSVGRGVDLAIKILSQAMSRSCGRRYPSTGFLNNNPVLAPLPGAPNNTFGGSLANDLRGGTRPFPDLSVGGYLSATTQGPTNTIRSNSGNPTHSLGTVFGTFDGFGQFQQNLVIKKGDTKRFF